MKLNEECGAIFGPGHGTHEPSLLPQPKSSPLSQWNRPTLRTTQQMHNATAPDSRPQVTLHLCFERSVRVRRSGSICRKLNELDATTKVPFILIELTGAELHSFRSGWEMLGVPKWQRQDFRRIRRIRRIR